MPTLDSGPIGPPIEPAALDAIFEEPSRLTLVAQPIVDLHRAAVVGYELLSRFVLPTPAPPDVVFGTALQRGKGAALEALVLGRALELARSAPPNCFITVNTSPRHLGQPEVQAVLAGRSLHGIVIELTEHQAFRGAAALRRTLDELREAGAIVALDDAGSGYAGLKQILAVEPEILKLDRELLTGIDTSEAKRVMVAMIGELADRLDAWVLAEGVETAEEADALMKLGVPLGQGYFYARPAPPWSSLAEPARTFMASAILATDQIATRSTVAHLVAPCSSVSGSEAWGSARLVVRVDGSRRPTVMRVATESGELVRAASQLLRVKRDASLGEVARRAIARSDEHRWDPIVVIDERGNFEGVVTVERLVVALADLSADTAAPHLGTSRPVKVDPVLS